MILRVLTLALLAYAGFCALLFFQQRGLIYYPQYTGVAPELTNLELRRDGVTLRGWQHQSQRRHALLYFGGNGERVEYAAAELAERLSDHAVYALAYRGYGASEGRPSEGAMVGDALALYDYVRQRHGDGSIAVLGRSLGGGVGAQVAAGRTVAALVLVTPFDSLVELAQSMYPFVPVRWLLRDRYESIRHLAAYPGAILVVRAGRDEVIPPAATDRLLAGLPASTRVLDLADAGHNDLDADRRYLDTVVEFLGADPAIAEPESKDQ